MAGVKCPRRYSCRSIRDLTCSILRARGLTGHLLPLAAGFKQSKFRPRGREGALENLEGFCQVVEEAVAIGSRDLDRLSLARELLGRVTKPCRRSLRLPQLVELFLSRPLVTVPLFSNLDLAQDWISQRLADHY